MWSSSSTSRRAAMLYAPGCTSSIDHCRNSTPADFSPSGRITPEAVARLSTTSSIAHIGTPSTSTTRGTRSTYAAGAFFVQRSCGSVRCESTSMMRRSLMSTAFSRLGVGYAAVTKLPMGDLLAYHAERHPTRVAVHCLDDAITYGDLDRWANRLARAYADRGVGFGDLVTIALPNGTEFYAAAFA